MIPIIIYGAFFVLLKSGLLLVIISFLFSHLMWKFRIVRSICILWACHTLCSMVYYKFIGFSGKQTLLLPLPKGIEIVIIFEIVKMYNCVTTQQIKIREPVFSVLSTTQQLNLSAWGQFFVCFICEFLVICAISFLSSHQLPHYFKTNLEFEMTPVPTFQIKTDNTPFLTCNLVSLLKGLCCF